MAYNAMNYCAFMSRNGLPKTNQVSFWSCDILSASPTKAIDFLLAEAKRNLLIIFVVLNDPSYAIDIMRQHLEFSVIGADEDVLSGR